MSNYLALYFHSASGHKPVLKKWLAQHGKEVKTSEVLFVYGEGQEERKFVAPVAGIFKAFLWNEGTPLEGGSEIAVMEVSKKDAAQCEQSGVGKVIQPDELKALADAASIRLPPEES
jgi:hypothetical protein